MELIVIFCMSTLDKISSFLSMQIVSSSKSSFLAAADDGGDVKV